MGDEGEARLLPARCPAPIRLRPAAARLTSSERLVFSLGAVAVAAAWVAWARTDAPRLDTATGRPAQEPLSMVCCMVMSGW